MDRGDLRATTALDLRDLRIAGGVMLAVAALVPVLPGPDGVPCPLRTLTGMPCPLCGMATSVTSWHLDPAAALAANPAGVLAVLWPSGCSPCGTGGTSTSRCGLLPPASPSCGSGGSSASASSSAPPAVTAKEEVYRSPPVERAERGRAHG